MNNFTDDASHFNSPDSNLQSNPESKISEEPKQTKKRMSPRRIAREIAFQALYAHQMQGESSEHAAVQLLNNPMFHKSDQAFALLLVRSVLDSMDALVASLAPHLNRTFDSLNMPEQSVLLMASWELLHTQTPKAVVMNEYIELTKRFGGPSAHGYINAVLDEFSGAA